MPKRFTLGAHTIEVKKNDELHANTGKLGMAYLNENFMVIDGAQPRSAQVATYCHELMHVILYNTAYHKLCDDEQFVERIGQALCQVLMTAKGEQ